ncbi:hypothetical protein PSHT_08446 [Puccinia striiformis]|uniref:Uncharacterized protein n=1 Tax=Puccinia striiformis TaxID=27350 RepID=A0A2S4VPR5_9BASI|nr:hypothetical protein PSHT_08446 [Puccinia striiformis]
MSATRTPNHPVIVSGHFKPLSPSVPESVRGNQYGFVSTPSYFQCAGIGGNKSDVFEVLLKTNTILTHSLDVGSVYYLSGKLIAMNDGSTPVLTYFESSLIKIGPAGDNQPDFKNKTSIVGLGHVAKREELIGNDGDSGNRLEVEIVHHDWDVQTHTLYVMGRKAEIAGNLVDFEVETNTAVVMVNVVSLTSGHSVGRMAQTPSGSGASSPRKGLNLDSLRPTPEHSHFPSSPSSGKRKATGKSSESENDSVKSDAMEVEVEVTPKSSSTRTSARKLMMQAAAKRMKRL